MTEFEIFDAARKLADPAARAAFLDQACDGDAAKRNNIEALLREHERHHSDFDAAPPWAADDQGPGLASTIVPRPVADSRVIAGKYKLLQDIGEGGMGAVYMAEQLHPIRRKVAVKLIKLGMDSKSVIARFEAERQALALMDHPHIAKVLDAGTDETGRPYFVMEYVKGRPITEYADKQKLSIAERLELVEQICQAIQHAHHKGVIHRDLKPSNVLVMTEDGKPFAKVIDFGIAKAVGQQLTDKTYFTLHDQFLGTPQYMSPEQAEGNLDIDTRTDVYSLGVLLYELLTGTPPFSTAELKAAAWDQFRKQIIDVDPLKPSLRLSASGPALLTLAASRHTDPKKLGKLVRGELDWIVMKALEKDRKRRYETPTSLANDLRAYLSGNQVLAAPPSAVYLFQKFVQRHRGPVIAAALVALTLVVGIIGTSYGLWRATEAEQTALQSEHTALTALGEKDIALKAMNAALEETSRERNAKALALAGERQQLSAAEANLKLADRRLYHAEMNLAQLKWGLNHIHPILSTLAKYRSPDHARSRRDDFPGFEYYYLEQLCNHSYLTLIGHTWRVNHVVYSPNGKRLASASSDRTVRVWDAEIGQEVLSLKGHTDSVSAVAFSPNGQRLASASSDRTVRLWDSVSGKQLLAIEGHAERVTSVAFSPDGQKLASAGSDRTLRLWDADTGQEVLAINGHADSISSVAFSPNGQRVASSSSDRTVKIWNAKTGQEVVTLRGHAGTVSSIAFSPGGQQLASAGLDRTIKVWNSATGELVTTLSGHTGGVHAVLFSPDGRRLASSGVDNTVKVWNATTGREVLTLKGHTRGVSSVSFQPNGWQLASASWDHTVKVWDTTTSQDFLSLKGHRSWVLSVAFKPDGSRIASASADGIVKIWDVMSGQESMSFSGHQGGVNSVAFSWSGERVASADVNHEIKVWDATTGQELFALKGHTDAVTCVAFSPDDNRLASSSLDRTVKEWDMQTGQEVLTLRGHTAPVSSISFSPDGTRLASASQDRTIKEWDPVTGEELLTLKGHTGAVRSLAFSPDGRQLASGGDDNTIKIWNARTGDETLSMTGHSYWVLSVTFSPDGRRLASSSGDGTIKIWDADTGQESLTFNSEFGGVWSVAFCSQGGRLVSAHEDGSARLWDARPWTRERRVDQCALGVVRHLVENQRLTRNGVIDRIANDRFLTLEQRERALVFAEGWRIADEAADALAAWKKLPSTDARDSFLGLKVAALCAWNKWDDDLAAVRSDSILLGERTNQPDIAERCAKICCITANTDLVQLERARNCVKAAIEKNPNHRYVQYFHLALGMAEYRLGEYERALPEFELITKDGITAYTLPVTAALYRAMTLAQLGRLDEAKSWHAQAIEKMRPIPEADQNPLANGANADDLIVWLASRECATVLMGNP